jgi:hypothetical protein
MSQFLNENSKARGSVTKVTLTTTLLFAAKKGPLMTGKVF